MLHSALADLTLLAGLGLFGVSHVGPEEQASLSTGFPPSRAAVDTWCRKPKTFRVTLHDPDYMSVCALGCCGTPPCVPAEGISFECALQGEDTAEWGVLAVSECEQSSE